MNGCVSHPLNSTQLQPPFSAHPALNFLATTEKNGPRQVPVVFCVVSKPV